MTTNNKQSGLEFIIGEERKLLDIISKDEIMQLLKGAVTAGAHQVLLCNEHGVEICSFGAQALPEFFFIEKPLFLEGENVGRLIVRGKADEKSLLQGVANMLIDAIQMIITYNLKRMLTTEIHTTVISQSYEELLTTNRKLTASEAKYRDLATSLEEKVSQRTKELKQVYARLLQQEKIAAVGQLAAGVAHEINNPLGFITSNLNTLERYIIKITEMLNYFRSTFETINLDDELRENLHQKWRDVKLDFVLSDIDELLQQSIEGCDRVKSIVADLRGFAHIDHAEDVVVDLNQELDQLFRVINHQIPQDAQVVKKYGKLPGFRCNPGLLSQVFLNIILNALQMKQTGLQLTVTTSFDGKAIEVILADNGPGIQYDTVTRIFDPFFTTKDVGQGMGMGLTNALEIVKSLGGTLEVRSEPEQGASFLITFPSSEKSNG